MGDCKYACVWKPERHRHNCAQLKPTGPIGFNQKPSSIWWPDVGLGALEISLIRLNRGYCLISTLRHYVIAQSGIARNRAPIQSQPVRQRIWTASARWVWGENATTNHNLECTASCTNSSDHDLGTRSCHSLLLPRKWCTFLWTSIVRLSKWFAIVSPQLPSIT